MDDAVFGSLWPVAECGYEIVKVPLSEVRVNGMPIAPQATSVVPVLRPRDHDQPRAQQANRRAYSPLDHPAMFREFASVPSGLTQQETVDGIVAFANQYGMLSGAVGAHVASLAPIDMVIAWPGGSGWTSEIVEMRACLQLWDALEQEDEEMLCRLVTLERERVIVDIPDGVVALGWIQLTESVNRHVTMLDHRHLMTAMLAWDVKRPRPSLRYEPESLISALWLQLMMAIDGNRKFAPCREPTCSHWFEVDPAAVKAGKYYCSNACRMRDYRRRRSERQSAAPVDGGTAAD